MIYPTAGWTSRTEGLVVVEAELSGTGAVVAARALSGPDHLTDPSVANIKKWKFRANKQSRVIVVYDFKIEGDCNTGQNGHFVLLAPNHVSIRGCHVTIQTSGAKPD
jgi:hypothetical protein